MPHGTSDRGADSYDAEPLLDDEEAHRLQPLDQDGSLDTERRSRQRVPFKYPDQRRREHSIAPLFVCVQRAPLLFIDRYAPTTPRKAIVLVAACGLWILFFSILIARGASTAAVLDLGSLKRLSCIFALW
jgi:hypothetical protein